MSERDDWNDDNDEKDDLKSRDKNDGQHERQNSQYVNNDLYQFNIAGDQVTGIVKYDNRRIEIERKEWDEQWVYREGQVVKTEHDDGYLVTTIFTDANGDGFFNKISEGHELSPTQVGDVKVSPDHARYVNDQYVGDDYWAEGYRFTISDGIVTQVVEVDDGRERIEIPDWNESWVVQGTNVLKLETYQSVTETSVYSDVNGDGIYSKISELYGSSATDPAALIPAEWQYSHATAGAQKGLVTVFGDEGIVDDIFLTYEAAFNRAADAEGLGYWVAQAKQGQNLTEIANNFLLSQEFSSRYGDSMSDRDFVEALYQNVLDRSSDAEGHEYWVQNLESGKDNRSEVLASFAISSENVTNLADDLAAGIQYSAFMT